MDITYSRVELENTSAQRYQTINFAKKMYDPGDEVKIQMHKYQ